MVRQTEGLELTQAELSGWMPGARTSRPPDSRRRSLFVGVDGYQLFALRAQCGRDVRGPSRNPSDAYHDVL